MSNLAFDILNNDVGERIKKLRIDKSMSQRDFARSLSISPGHICQIETGKTKPGYEIMRSLYQTHNVSMDWLLTGEGPMFRTAAPPPPTAEIPPVDLPKAQLIQWINDFWQHADQEGRAWLFYEVKRHFPEFIEYLKKIESG